MAVALNFISFVLRYVITVSMLYITACRADVEYTLKTQLLKMMMKGDETPLAYLHVHKSMHPQLPTRAGNSDTNTITRHKSTRS
ncbi:hypothetical protein Hdeb2414_s0023g00625191 [Helianthus debilis subsp. tardiflorus]